MVVIQKVSRLSKLEFILLNFSSTIKENMKYKVIISCPDCTDEDPQGCFDGGTEEEIFDTFKKAEEYGWKITGDNIWKFEIVEV